MIHIPVLVEEVLAVLRPLSNAHFIDATIGEGSHAKVLLEKIAPKGVLLGIDKDADQIERARNTLSKFGKRIILTQGSFKDIRSISHSTIRKKKIQWSGILFDLGWSQAHRDVSKRGFSFLKEEDLDMRYDVNASLTAKEIVNTWKREDIETILTTYGQEPFAHSISAKIVAARRGHSITTTKELVNIILGATPGWYKRRRIHPATQTFQALRIAVNNELEELKEGIRSGIDILKKGGIVAVITFHSGEDRLVKRLFLGEEKEGKGHILTKKPIVPSHQEIKKNPRARSAKLRAFQKI